VIGFVLVLLLLVGGSVAAWSRREAARREAEAEARRSVENNLPPRRVAPPPKEQVAPPTPADDHLVRADKIRRDYDEMTAKFSADYSAAGNAFPGGLSAYLRQLALLQREKHKDLAALLTPRELEDLEMRDTPAGQTVAQQLGDTAATEEQRRAVFRLQKEFEDQYALIFDLTPPALLARETDRQALQQKIRAVLGDDLFGSWLRGEGPDYAGFVAFVQQAGLAAGTALDLWRSKSDFVAARLQLKARTDLAPPQLAEAERALNAQALTRVTGLLGPAAVAGPAREILTWLPPPK
jgi:hypothetical protein